MLDMDVPVDGSDAFVLTTPSAPEASRAARADPRRDRGTRRPQRRGPTARAGAPRSARRRGDPAREERPLARRRRRLLPYDGFTIITLGWLENIGWCGPGEASKFIADSWDDAAGRMMIDGRVPVNSHGGFAVQKAARAAPGTSGRRSCNSAAEKARARYPAPRPRSSRRAALLQLPGSDPPRRVTRWVRSREPRNVGWRARRCRDTS